MELLRVWAFFWAQENNEIDDSNLIKDLFVQFERASQSGLQITINGQFVMKDNMVHWLILVLMKQ